MTNWNQIAAELDGLEIVTDADRITKLSLDYYHFSPVLQAQLSEKRADLVVRAATETDVLKVARVCVKNKIPLTVRGAGTGNYGQCIPLAGGIVLDVTPMNKIRWIKPGLASVEPGVKMAAFDKKAREIGWELRMYPSTYRTATIGGFIGGGSVGAGSINYGQLRDRGNLHAVRIVTMEDEPKILELRSDEVQQVNHAYGTNGIIIELEIPLAPAYPWAELIVTFDEFLEAAKFGQAIADSDGLVKKWVSVFADPIPTYFTALKDYIPTGKSCALLTIAETSLEPFDDLVKEWGGEITYKKIGQEAKKGTSLVEFGWNHTTLHARSIDPNLTYLQTFYWTLERVEQMYRYFGDEVMIHLEFVRVGGTAIPVGIQLVRYSTEERLNEIIKYHEDNGAGIGNPHTYILEDGGRKVVDPVQVAFKERVDPYGLLNPGKMRGWEERKQ
ncbi:MAG: FAD-binding oxidoreductase [Cyanobacteria bacterium SBLK]|nr:FAD-binding oxidoreductase [Cyanobacteria bacterium SBLK]